GAWFILTPQGQLFATQNFKPAAAPLTAVDPVVYDDPQLLFAAAPALTDAARQDLVSQQQQFGFHAGNSDFFNWLGLHEKWFQDRTGQWYFLTPQGQGYAWHGVNPTANAPAFTVDVAAYDNPGLLFQSNPPPSAGDLQQFAQLQQTYGFRSAGSY